MDTSTINALITALAGFVGISVGVLAQRYIANQALRIHKSTQRLEIYKRLNKSLVEIQDLIGFGGVSITHRRADKVTEFGVEADSLPEEGTSISFASVPKKLYLKALNQIDEATLLAGDEAKAALRELRGVLQSEIRPLLVNGVPEYLARIVPGLASDVLRDVPPDLALPLTKALWEHRERMNRSLMRVSYLLAQEL